ncbi:MAG TPA: hypothetical protein EYP10_08515 [Armatimonadetes bacterium]|nr:hypothetical protein [Armatimonadota bacterium]
MALKAQGEFELLSYRILMHPRIAKEVISMPRTDEIDVKAVLEYLGPELIGRALSKDSDEIDVKAVLEYLGPELIARALSPEEIANILIHHPAAKEVLKIATAKLADKEVPADAKKPPARKRRKATKSKGRGKSKR